jgi:signal transduction histidine kinase
MKERLPLAEVRYGVAVLAVTVALALAGLLPPREPYPALLFCAAVMASAWYGGLGPGLLATALSALALDFFFLPPVNSLRVGRAEGVCLGVFVLVAFLISSLNAAQRGRTAAQQQPDRRKDQFLAAVAHELRTPVAAASNALHVLRLQRPDPVAAEPTLEILARQVRHMGRLVDDLLEASRIGRGGFRLCKKPVELASVVTQAAEAARPFLDARHHRLEVSLPPESVRLDADPTRLEQILVNLLTNAAKYTAPGGKIQLAAERGRGEVRLRVRDNGRGLEPVLLPRLFDLFARAEEGSEGGLGIGLHLVRRLAEVHGGTVTAQSDGPGLGSEFLVRLPLPSHAPPGRRGE